MLDKILGSDGLETETCLNVPKKKTKFRNELGPSDKVK